MLNKTVNEIFKIDGNYSVEFYENIGLSLANTYTRSKCENDPKTKDVYNMSWRGAGGKRTISACPTLSQCKDKLPAINFSVLISQGFKILEDENGIQTPLVRCAISGIWHYANEIELDHIVAFGIFKLDSTRLPYGFHIYDNVRYISNDHHVAKNLLDAEKLAKMKKGILV